MKTAIYIEDGTVQLVITPETEFEKGALKSFYDRPMSATIFDGTFYDCRGGWIRQSAYHSNYSTQSDFYTKRDCSLIIRIDENSEENKS